MLDSNACMMALLNGGGYALEDDKFEMAEPMAIGADGEPIVTPHRVHAVMVKFSKGQTLFETAPPRMAEVAVAQGRALIVEMRGTKSGLRTWRASLHTAFRASIRRCAAMRRRHRARSRAAAPRSPGELRRTTPEPFDKAPTVPKCLLIWRT